MTRYTVMLCCNDERGNFTGRVEQVSIEDEIRLESRTERGLGVAFDRSLLRVSRRYFRCSNHQSCVGNIFHDAVSMEKDSAKLLVEYLIERGWSITEHACDGPRSGRRG